MVRIRRSFVLITALAVFVCMNNTSLHAITGIVPSGEFLPTERSVIGQNELQSDAVGSLSDNGNWTHGVLPSGVDGAVQMKMDAGMLTMDEIFVVGDMTMSNPTGYTIAGLGQLLFESADGQSTWDVQRGVNDIQLQTTLQTGTTGPSATTATNLTLNVAADASIEFNNDVILNGNILTVSGTGTTTFNNFVQGSINTAEAAIGGDGTIQGNLINNGTTLSPGDGIGTFTIEGNYIQGAAADLLIEIAGTHDYDVLRVLGNISLAGTLNVKLVGGYEPSMGEVFNIVRFGTLTGAFDTVNLPELTGGKQWSLSQLYATGTVSVIPEPIGLSLFTISLAFATIARRYALSRAFTKNDPIAN